MEWHLKNWADKLEMYDTGLSLGWSDPFTLGDIEGLQLDFYPNGDGEENAAGPTLVLCPGAGSFGYALFVGDETIPGVCTGEGYGREMAHHFRASPKTGSS